MGRLHARFVVTSQIFFSYTAASLTTAAGDRIVSQSRRELACDVLRALGNQDNDARRRLSDDMLLCEAKEALCERMRLMVVHLCEIGITQAKIAKAAEVDPAALCELAGGGAGRISFETMWEAFRKLSSFLLAARASLAAASGVGHALGKVELLGFSAHPDVPTPPDEEVLAIMKHNVEIVLDDAALPLKSLGDQLHGAASVHSRDGYLIFVAVVSPNQLKVMTRIAMDEIKHFENWLTAADPELRPPYQPRSSY